MSRPASIARLLSAAATNPNALVCTACETTWIPAGGIDCWACGSPGHPVGSLHRVLVVPERGFPISRAQVFPPG